MEFAAKENLVGVRQKKMTTVRSVEYGLGETGVKGEFQNVP